MEVLGKIGLLEERLGSRVHANAGQAARGPSFRRDVRLPRVLALLRLLVLRHPAQLEGDLQHFPGPPDAEANLLPRTAERHSVADLACGTDGLAVELRDDV